MGGITWSYQPSESSQAMTTAMRFHSRSRCSLFTVVTRNTCSSSGSEFSGVAVLIRRCLQEGDSRQVARASRVPEPGEVVQMIGLVGPPDHLHRRRRQMPRVGGGGEVLERVVMRDVVREAQRVVAGSTPTARSYASSGWLFAHVPSPAVANPPWNHPHVTPAAVSRSPMFRPVSAAVDPCEHTSQ